MVVYCLKCGWCKVRGEISGQHPTLLPAEDEDFLLPPFVTLITAARLFPSTYLPTVKVLASKKALKEKENNSGSGQTQVLAVVIIVLM